MKADIIFAQKSFLLSFSRQIIHISLLRVSIISTKSIEIQSKFNYHNRVMFYDFIILEIKI